MNEPLALTAAVIVGASLGVFFFGGLWWTVRRGVSSPRPAVWFLGSLLIRIAVTLTGFYFVAQSDWRRLLVCLLGFLLARVMVIRFTRPEGVQLWI